MTSLTDKTIRALKPQSGKQYSLSDKGSGSVRGLSLMVNPGGTKVFYYRYKTPARKTKRIKIGSYPSTGLGHARMKAREFKRRHDDGEDLALVASRSRLAKREVHTISDLWREYHLEAGQRKKSAYLENKLWLKHVDPYLGPLDIRSFTRDTVMDFLIPFRQENSPATGARIQALISQLGGFAVERRVLEFSPAYQLGKKKPLPSKSRFLSRYELAVFWGFLSDKEKLASADVSKSLTIALKLALCTGARRGEIAAMNWGEIDILNKTWVIPGDKTKNNRTHVLPISDLIISLVKQAKSVSRNPNSKWVFPGRRSEAVMVGEGHIRGDAITRACSRICKHLGEHYDIEKFSPHDLRRTCATHMASDLKVDRYTISQILNHTSDRGGGGAVTDVYARYDYLEEKTAAIQAWTDYIQENAEAYS